MPLTPPPSKLMSLLGTATAVDALDGRAMAISMKGVYRDVSLRKTEGSVAAKQRDAKQRRINLSRGRGLGHCDLLGNRGSYNHASACDNSYVSTSSTVTKTASPQEVCELRMYTRVQSGDEPTVAPDAKRGVYATRQRNFRSVCETRRHMHLWSTNTSIDLTIALRDSAVSSQFRADSATTLSANSMIGRCTTVVLQRFWAFTA